MSIKVITAVWDKSQHKGNNLLTLLALADNANDDGYCWPGLETIAKKTRVSRNTVIRCMKTLEETAEIYVSHNRRHGNKYLILVGFSKSHVKKSLERYYDMSVDEAGEIVRSIYDQSSKYQNDTYQNDTSEVNPSSHQKLHSCDTSEVNPSSQEPSITVNEPSNKEPSAKAPDDHQLIKDYTVEIVFSGNTAQYGRAGDIANWAQCRNEKEQWSKYHLAAPFTFDEWQRFLQAYKRKGIDWPSNPEKWNKQAYNWRLTEASKPAPYTPPPVPDYSPDEITARIPGGV